MYRPYNSVPSPNPFADVESSIRSLTLDYCTSFNTGNYDQVAAMFAPEAILMAPNREPVVGRKGIENLIRSYGEEGYGELRMETTRSTTTSARAIHQTATRRAALQRKQQHRSMA